MTPRRSLKRFAASAEDSERRSVQKKYQSDQKSEKAMKERASVLIGTEARYVFENLRFFKEIYLRPIPIFVQGTFPESTAAMEYFALAI